MKLTLTYLSAVLLAMGSFSVASGQLAVGDASEVLPHTIFENGTLTNTTFEQHEGKVILAYYYTPW